MQLPSAAGAVDWSALLLHFFTLSVLAVGGARSSIPDSHRYLVTEMHWLSDAQFSSSLALGQIAPGPNFMFIALIGWNIGMNAGGYATALLGATLCMTGIILPSTVITCAAAHWLHRHRSRVVVRAFTSAMAPIVVSLILYSGWLLTQEYRDAHRVWPLWLLTLIAVIVTLWTKVHLHWLLAVGALIGAFLVM